MILGCGQVTRVLVLRSAGAGFGSYCNWKPATSKLAFFKCPGVGGPLVVPFKVGGFFVWVYTIILLVGFGFGMPIWELPKIGDPNVVP